VTDAKSGDVPQKSDNLTARLQQGSVSTIGLFFYTLFNIFNAAVMDVAGSHVQAATYGHTSLITQLVVIPAPMITGYLIGGLGIKFAFVLA